MWASRRSGAFDRKCPLWTYTTAGLARVRRRVQPRLVELVVVAVSFVSLQNAEKKLQRRRLGFAFSPADSANFHRARQSRPFISSSFMARRNFLGGIWRATRWF